MAATQRPVTQAALSEGLATDRPAWKDIPSWHVFSDQDRNIPVAVLRAGAERASSRGTTEIAGRLARDLGLAAPTPSRPTIAEAGKAYVASLATAAA